MSMNGNRGNGSENMDLVFDNFDPNDIGLGNENDYENDLNDLSESLDDAGDDLGDDGDRVSHTRQQEIQRRQQRDPDQQRRQPQQRQQRDQQRQQQQQPRRLPTSAEVRADDRGNLIGPDGKVVAKAGFEARMYQDLHRSRGELGRTQSQLTDTSGRLNRAVEIGQTLHTENVQLKERIANLSGTKLGLNDQETIQAMQLAAESKTNPVAAIKRMLTMAAARGVDLTQIGVQNGGVDSKALVDLVREEMAKLAQPLQQQQQLDRQRREQEQQQQQQNQNAEQEVMSFFQQNPDAQQHLKIFEQVLANPQFSKMSLGEVWARIQLNLMRNERAPQRNNIRQNPLQQRRSLPAGRGMPQSSNADIASPNASYDEILRGVLDEVGVQ